MSDPSALSRLQQWYLAHCDGDWEHSWGLKIDTLDNPGWSLTIDLNETELENARLVPLERNHGHPTDWITYKIENSRFIGYCGPEKLESLIVVFLDWTATAAAKTV